MEWGELRILGSAAVRESKKNVIDGEISDLYGVSKSVKKAIAKAWENLAEIPSDIVISLSSALTFSDIINMNYVRDDKDTSITMEEIDSVVKKIEYTSLERVKGKIKERTGIIESEMKLVTTSIISIQVDGKKITNPIGFCGKNIKLGIINIFMPLSYVNAIQNIGRGISKNIISLIPSIITIPKLIETTDENFDSNCFIDFWHTKTTVVLENHGEILGGNTLNFGFSLLEDEFRRKEPKFGYLYIDHCITNIESEYPPYAKIFDSFFNLLFDALFVANTDITKHLYLKNIYISGWGASDFLWKKLEQYLKTKSIGNDIRIQKTVEKIDAIPEKDSSAFANVFSLAKTTEEMLLLKKDPIARILRYIIYRYE